jgi:predicted MFS family arabinose efflux permease
MAFNALSEKILSFTAFLVLPFHSSLQGLAQNYFWLTVAIIIGGASNAIKPKFAFTVNSAAPTHYRGAIMSLNGMGLRVGQTVGPIIMAMLLAIVTVDVAFYIIGGATVIITIALFSTLLSNREYTVKT